MINIDEVAPIYKHTPFEQIEGIVQFELVEAMSLLLEPEYDEGGHLILPDWELISSMKRVIEYFVSKEEWVELEAEIDQKRQELEDRFVQ